MRCFAGDDDDDAITARPARNYNQSAEDECFARHCSYDAWRLPIHDEDAAQQGRVIVETTTRGA